MGYDKQEIDRLIKQQRAQEKAKMALLLAKITQDKFTIRRV